MGAKQYLLFEAGESLTQMVLGFICDVEVQLVFYFCLEKGLKSCIDCFQLHALTKTN